MKKVFLFVVLLIALLFGAINPIGLGETVNGVSRAVKGEPGTFLYIKDTFVVFGWSHGQNYAFLITKTTGEVLRDFTKIPGFTGQSMDLTNSITFIRSLEKLGFRQATPQDLPPNVLAAYGSWKYILGQIGLPKLTVIFLPAGAVDLKVIERKDT